MMRNGGQWTESRYRSFITSALRSASQRWPVKHRVKKAAWKERGIYECRGYQCDPHRVPASIRVGTRRVNNVLVDHCSPVVDPEVGFTTWDNFIERLFSEADNLQVLCRECHSRKSVMEKLIRTQSKKVKQCIR